jgi:hypothetical protein
MKEKDVLDLTQKLLTRLMYLLTRGQLRILGESQNKLPLEWLRNDPSEAFRRMSHASVKLHKGFLALSTESGSAKDSNELPRIFLAMWTIVYYPRELFREMERVEEILYDKACHAMACFFTALRHLSTTKSFLDIPTRLSMDLPVHLADYMEAFNDWRIPDNVRLSGKICKAMFLLCHAEAELRVLYLLDSDEIRAETARYYSRLAKMNTPAYMASFDTTMGMFHAWMQELEVMALWDTSTAQHHRIRKAIEKCLRDSNEAAPDSKKQRSRKLRLCRLRKRLLYVRPVPRPDALMH